MEYYIIQRIEYNKLTKNSESALTLCSDYMEGNKIGFASKRTLILGGQHPNLILKHINEKMHS